MTKLKVELVKMDRAVVMQVLEQEEGTRDKDALFRHGGLTLYSKSCPALDNQEVYVRGYACEWDFNPCGLPFNSNAERDEYYDKVKALVQAYNASLLGTEQGCMREIVE